LISGDEKEGITTKETTEEVVEVNAEGETEALDEVEYTSEEAVDDLENSVDGVIDLLEELGLQVSAGLEQGEGYIQ
jgi:hypothetical protein